MADMKKVYDDLIIINLYRPKYRILTNDDEVCIPCLSSIFLAVSDRIVKKIAEQDNSKCSSKSLFCP